MQLVIRDRKPLLRMVLTPGKYKGVTIAVIYQW